MTTMLHPETAQQILDTWAKKPLDFEPGTQWQYSNTNFVIAGAHRRESHRRSHYMDFLTQHIFRPLGMTSVWNSDQTKLTQTDATPYYRHALGPLRVAPKEGRGWMFAAGELAMTAHDLALWDESLLAQSVLKPESYKEMFTEVKLKNGKGTHYGLGVEVRDYNGHRSIEHGGEVSGFVSDNEVLIDDGAAVAVLTNQDAVGAASTIARLAAPVVAGYPPTAEEQQAIDIYHGLQQGQIDRASSPPTSATTSPPKPSPTSNRSLAPSRRTAHLPPDTHEQLRGGMTFRAFTHHLSRQAPDPHHLHLPRRQAGAVPDRPGGVVRRDPSFAGLVAQRWSNRFRSAVRSSSRTSSSLLHRGSMQRGPVVVVMSANGPGMRSPCHRMAIEVGVDALEHRQRFHVALHGHRQLQLVRIEHRRNVRHGSVLVPAMLLAPRLQIVPLRRLGELDAQEGLREERVSFAACVDVAVRLVARVGELDRRAAHA